MQLAEVIGTLVAAHADRRLEGLRLLLLQEIDARGHRVGGTVVAADAIGATDGDVVLVSHGEAARSAGDLAGRPVDCSVIAIVDRIEPGAASDRA